MTLKCPEQPEKNKGSIGQYHCPYCGMMLVAGMPHPFLISYAHLEFKSGWYGMLPNFEFIGPFDTEQKAEKYWLRHFKIYTGKDFLEIINGKE